MHQNYLLFSELHIIFISIKDIINSVKSLYTNWRPFIEKHSNMSVVAVNRKERSIRALEIFFPAKPKPSNAEFSGANCSSPSTSSLPRIWWEKKLDNVLSDLKVQIQQIPINNFFSSSIFFLVRISNYTEDHNQSYNVFAWIFQIYGEINDGSSS